MHRRVRCPQCRHWTDALLVWAAGDSCPHCNSPLDLDVDGQRPAAGAEPKVGDWREDRPWRTPGRIASTQRLGGATESAPYRSAH